MKKIFISGSISIKSLPTKVKESLLKIINNDFKILVGDANGIDTLVQNFCINNNFFNLSIYYVDEEPRNIESRSFSIKKIKVDEEIKKVRERQTFKDEAMAKDCDYAFVIWDGKSSGSYNNIKNCLKLNKPVKIYLTEQNDFIKPQANDIDYIFSQNNGYTASQAVKFINETKEIFKNTREFNSFLIENKIMIKDGDKYKPTKNFEDLFLEQLYKGQISSYKFTDKAIDEIVKIYNKSSLF